MIGTCNLRARNERIETGVGRESGEKSALRGERDNAIGGKQLDSVQEETPVVSAAQVFVDRKAQSSSLAPEARTQTGGRKPSKGFDPTLGESFWIARLGAAVFFFSKGTCTNPSCFLASSRMSKLHI